MSDGDESVVAQYRRTQRYPPVVGVAAQIIHIPHDIHRMSPDTVPADGIGMEHKGEIDLGHSRNGVGTEGEI